MTVLTCVCWSMISEIQIAYGSRVRRHGRSRALPLNQLSNGRTSARVRSTFDPRPSTLAHRLRCTVAELTTTPYHDSTIVKPLTSYTCTLTEPEAGVLEKFLGEHGYEFSEVPYARFAAGKDKV